MADPSISDDALRSHLSAAYYAYIAQGVVPAPADVAAECVRLRERLFAITSFMPAALVRAQIAAPHPGRVSGAFWDGTALFADLSGFTALSERLSALGKQGAEEISGIINQMFGALADEARRYGGELLKFGGDALTVFFAAAALGLAHGPLAAQAALAMQARMAAFANLATPAGTFTLRLRIGVHSGEVFAAQVGDRDHIELVVTGPNVNRVATAQEIADPGEVVVSGETLALLVAAEAIERRAGFFLLEGMLPVAPPPPPGPPFAPGPSDLAELLWLVARAEALRPYLPFGLPERFVAAPGPTPEIGEFRPVTVLFANFYAFSAALAALPDRPDLAAKVLNAYFQRAQAIIHRYGGIVNKVDMYTHGDKLMALFGAPVVHEDDPLRATLAALELRVALEQANEEIAGLQMSLVLAQRIGLNTGVVFAGQVGSAQRHEYTVMGQHVNLAARLMTVAAEGAVVLSPSTAAAVGGQVVLEHLAPVRLKGVAAPVPIAAALHPLPLASHSRRVGARPPLVGRTEELAALVALGAMALRGQGQVAALAGDAGTGKTRLIDETVLHLLGSTDAHGTLPHFNSYRVECQSYDQRTPYAAARELLRQFFSLNLYPATDAAAAAVLRRTEELAPDLARFGPTLGDLLNLPLADTPLTATLSPEQRHDRAEELVVSLLLAEARDQPLVLVADDLQWIDDSSQALLMRLAARAAEAPMLLLLGYRPEPLTAVWNSFATHIQVGELPPNGSADLVRALLQGEPPAALATLTDKAQGNPFFLEELIRSLVEAGVLEQGQQGWQLARAPGSVAVPNSIEGVITARLDRLEERSREVLQVAAVVGRRFAYPILLGLLMGRLNVTDVAERLAALTADDLIAPEDLELAYLFKHALTRDVAYETILYARRRDLHRRVAQQIETTHGERLDDQLPLLARHTLLAEEWERTFDYHLRAGRQAQLRYANREAIALFDTALLVAPRLTPDLPYLVEIHERLGVIHALIGQYEVALERYNHALGLLSAHPAPPLDELLRLHHHIARVYEKRADFDTAFSWVERATALEGADDSTALASAVLLGAGLHSRQGRYSQATAWGERALGIAIASGNLRDQAQALKLLGGTALNLGDSLRAIDLLTRSLALYEQTNDLSNISYAHNDLAVAYFELGRLADSRHHYEAGAAIKSAIGDVYGEGMIACNLGELLKLQGDLAGALREYRHGLAIYEQIGSLYMTGVLQMNLGSTYLLQGDAALAAPAIAQARDLFARAGAEDFLPELERYEAELALLRGDLPAARRAAEGAIATAVRLEASAEEGITRRTLAHILAQGGDLPAAQSELERSLAMLREAASPHEIARTLVASAALSIASGAPTTARAALAEAIPILREVGAERDLEQALALADA